MYACTFSVYACVYVFVVVVRNLGGDCTEGIRGFTFGSKAVRQEEFGWCLVIVFDQTQLVLVLWILEERQVQLVAVITGGCIIGLFMFIMHI